MLQSKTETRINTVQKRLALTAAGAAILALTLLVPIHQANAALLDRVNEAIREAGVKTTVARSDAFQQGIYIGHYTSYTQLVGAIAYHKANETLPTFTATEPAVATKCLTGKLLSWTPRSLYLQGDVAGLLEEKSMSLAQNQYDRATFFGAGQGATITACTADNYASVYGHLTVH